MAQAKNKDKAEKAERDQLTAPPILEAADGGSSDRTKGYSENPDAPGDAIAQVEDLVED